MENADYHSGEGPASSAAAKTRQAAAATSRIILGSPRPRFSPRRPPYDDAGEPKLCVAEGV